jgi:hypothetical protein
MKNTCLLIALFALFVGISSLQGRGFVSQAQASSHHTVPLAIIRFNQPRVYFQQPLSNAVRSAHRVSSDIAFKIKHYVPVNRQLQQRAEANLGQVIQHLYGLGVRADQIQVTKQLASSLSSSEVHLYVQP